MEPIGRDARILFGQPQNLPSSAFDRKSLRQRMKRRKKLSLELEEEGAHIGGERAQPGEIQILKGDFELPLSGL